MQLNVHGKAGIFSFFFQLFFTSSRVATSPRLANSFMTETRMFTATLSFRKGKLEKNPSLICWKLREDENKMKKFWSLTLWKKQSLVIKRCLFSKHCQKIIKKNILVLKNRSPEIGVLISQQIAINIVPKCPRLCYRTVWERYVDNLPKGQRLKFCGWLWCTENW